MSIADLTHLTPKELAARWRMAEGTLQNYRTQGKGPKFIRFGMRVLYPMAEVICFEAAHLKQNTGQ